MRADDYEQQQIRLSRSWDLVEGVDTQPRKQVPPKIVTEETGMTERIRIERVKALFALAVASTNTLPPTEEAEAGFVVGFRMYERLANAMGRAIPDEALGPIVERDTKKESAP